MAFFDLPLDQLQAFMPKRVEPSDFDTFWKTTLDETRRHPLDARFEPMENGLVAHEFFDVTFSGFDGQPIKGWLVIPRRRCEADRIAKIPCVIEFIGYGGGRGFPSDWLFWASAGYAHFIMDTRGQGSSWRTGDTPDRGATGAPSIPGFMTQGILDPKDYYYRRLFTDAARAVEAARAHPNVDASRIAVSGGSQGGALTIAAAALTPDVQIALPDVPFLCCFQRATELVDTYPYQEICRYLNVHRDRVEQVFRTLAYFDCVNFAARAKARALFAVGLMDTTCPPSTVYAAYNHWAGQKEIRVYTYNNHEGGGDFHTLEKLKLLKATWG